MPTINKINIGGVTYDLSDETSSYGKFSVTPGTIDALTPGATLIATINYKQMPTNGSVTSLDEVPISSVDLYSWSSIGSNGWYAEVEGTDLALEQQPLLPGRTTIIIVPTPTIVNPITNM